MNHRGPRSRSVATGGRAPGVGRSEAAAHVAAEIYENESTPNFAAENMRRCKSCFESFCFRLKLSFLSYTVLCVNL